MKNRRWSNADRHAWPFTWSSDCYRKFSIMLDSGANEGGGGDCYIRLSAFGVTLLCELPQVISHYRERHAANWDAETVARLGRNWYEEVFPREYGFTISEGTLHLHYGAQTHDSCTTKSHVYFLPWRQWRYIRTSFYDLEGRRFWTQRQADRSDWAARQAVKDACPKAKFEFRDYDGQRVVATTHVEEMEWHFGEGWCRWLSWFRRPKVRRSLMLEFSQEVGPEKGSWKGGTVGHSIDMLPGETHEAAFRRYCEEEHRSKSGRYRVQYIGLAGVL